MKLSNLTLILTTDCNYSCSYCFQKKSKLYLDWSSAKKAIEFFYPYLDDGCYLTFYGGEPLLAFDAIRSAVERIETLEKSLKKNIRFSITTNGSLLADEIIDFLNEKNFFVLLSFDGNAQERRKKGSFELLIAVLDKILSCEKIEFATNSVFIPATVDSLFSSACFLLERNVPSIDLSFSTLVSWDKDSLLKLDAALVSLRSCLLEYYRNKEKIPITNFLKRDGNKIFSCGAGFNRMALSPEGYLWGCCFFYDLAQRQKESLEENSFCFGSLDSFMQDMNSIYPKVMEEYKPLGMEYFFTKDNFCQFCPDLKNCAVCPVEAAFSTQIIGMIPTQACEIRRVFRKHVREFWKEIG